jgi:hypothetical protein
MEKAYIRLRQTLGIFGIALPVLVLVFGQFGENRADWWHSISATFYSNAGPLFIWIMGAVGCFLGIYGGYSLLDKVINRSAGAASLVLTFFPCSASDAARVGILYIPIGISNTIHCAAAAVFFALLAFNILFLFTKGGPSPTKWKIWRNRIYYVCGLGILFFMAIQVVSALWLPSWMTIINETGMLWFFGFAWLVKGETLLKDK